MARLRFVGVALLALALAGNSTPMGRTQTRHSRTEDPTQHISCATCTSKPVAANDRSCVIYSLTDLGYDADLGKWIAQTLPEMIEPSSWKDAGGSGVLRYYAPKNVLMVNQSAAVQSKVEGFLKNLKTSLPKGSQTNFASGQTAPKTNVVPAEYNAPAPLRASNPLPETSSYPVPAPVKSPKHLFHFLIRYEGEGLIDDNVVKFMKGYLDASKDGGSQVPVQATARGYAAPNGTVMPSSYTTVSPAQLSPATLPPAPVASPSVTTEPPVAQPKQSKDKKKAPEEKDDKEVR